MTRIGLLLAASLAFAVAAPAAGQTTDETWCAGLFDYLDEHTRLSFSDEAASIAGGGCVEYIGASGGPLTTAGPVSAPEDDAFARFADRALGAMTQVQRAAGSGLSQGRSFEDEARSFEALGAWATSERQWLLENPPEACWADLHDQWTKGIEDIAGGARTMVAGIREEDLEKVSIASDRMLGAVELLNELRARMDELDC